MFLITGIFYGNLQAFGLRNNGNPLLSAGFYFDALSVIFLIVMLLLTSRVPAYNKNLAVIKAGFVIWISGQAFDLADELINQPRWIAFWCEDLLVCAGMCVVCIFSFRLISDINHDFFRASVSAYTDHLTNLPNRRHFFKKISASGGDEFTLLLIDIDHFKRINDTFGHDAGDDVLRQYGALLMTFYSGTCFPARTGGEEFAVLCTGSVEESERLAQSIFLASKNVRVNGDLTLSVSMGAGMRRKGENPDALMKRVDAVLYLAKQAGRNTIKWT